MGTARCSCQSLVRSEADDDLFRGRPVSDRADDRMTRARRVREIQKAVLPNDEDDNVEFSKRLLSAAREIGIKHPAMNPNRVAKLRTGAQLLQFEDAALLAAVDPDERGWLWLVFGISSSAEIIKRGGAQPESGTQIKKRRSG